MDRQQSFGGRWTEEKLGILTEYLRAYLRIFDKNPRAQLLHTIYVDAFAGTGYIRQRQGDASQLELVEELTADDALGYVKGSALRALELSPGFREYLFIEKNPDRCAKLKRLTSHFSGKKISIENVDAGECLRKWCATMDWRTTRALVFLDPYGMQVDWLLLEEIAKTKAIDLWLLFPLGAAVMRLLQKKQPPPQTWADRVTSVFGTDAWEAEFYKPRTRDTLFGPEDAEEREADYHAVADFFIRRLEGIFAQVAPNPRALRNSRNCPLYLLCFAAGNPKGAPTAVKIAKHLLGRY